MKNNLWSVFVNSEKSFPNISCPCVYQVLKYQFLYIVGLKIGYELWDQF